MNDDNQKETAAECEGEELKTLTEKLAYALVECETDEEMISYLQSIDDESVKAILKDPPNMVRELIKNTCADLLRVEMKSIIHKTLQKEKHNTRE